MAYDKNTNTRQDIVHSIKVHADRSRTYFFDLRKNRDQELYLVINESTRRPNGDGYDRHKLLVFQNDLMKFKEGLDGIIKHITANGLANLQASLSYKNDTQQDVDNDMHTGKENTDYRDTITEPAAMHEMDGKPPATDENEVSDNW